MLSVLNTESKVNHALLLWATILKTHNSLDIAVLCEELADEDEHGWKKKIYNILQEVLLDEDIIQNESAFNDCEKLVDRIMAGLNFGLAVGKKAVHLFRLTMAYTFRLIHENKWENQLFANPIENVEIDRALNSITMIFTGLVFRNITSWMEPGPLPVKISSRDLISQIDMASGRVNAAIVRGITDYLEQHKLIKFEV